MALLTFKSRTWEAGTFLWVQELSSEFQDNKANRETLLHTHKV